MTAEDVADKVRRFGWRRSEKTIEKLISMTLELEKVSDIRELMSIV
jgi:hypothetical protein